MSNPQTEPAGPKLEAGNEGESFRRYRLRTMTRIIYDQDVLSVGGNIATAIIMVIYVNGFISPFWFLSRRCHQFTDNLKNPLDLGVVTFYLSFKLSQFLGKLFVHREYFAQLDKSAHDNNIHTNGTIAI